MSATADQITAAALRLLGVKEAGETLSADESADGLTALNELLDEWTLQGYAQTSKKQLTQTLTPSDGTYTFGSGGNNSTRLVRITNAWIRDTNNNDSFLIPIPNDRYSEICDKTDESNYPTHYYYRADYPLGVVNLYPIPSAAYTLYLEGYSAFTAIASGATSVDLAPGYISALKALLAVRIAPEYPGSPGLGEVKEQAKERLAWIKRVNSNDRPRMNTGLPIGSRRDNYWSLFN